MEVLLTLPEKFTFTYKNSAIGNIGSCGKASNPPELMLSPWSICLILRDQSLLMQ